MATAACGPPCRVRPPAQRADPAAGRVVARVAVLADPVVAPAGVRVVAPVAVRAVALVALVVVLAGVRAVALAGVRAVAAATGAPMAGATAIASTDPA